MVIRENINNQIVAYQINTTNESFLNMHYYLKAKKVQNNKFFLTLYDTDLDGVDPRDPNLSKLMKGKILAECRRNFWYFIREVLVIPDQGGDVGGGVRYKLHRGNLALNFGFALNWSMFLELPRQFGKTISAVCWYLWVYNFGTTNSQIMFINKKHDDSKVNLQRLKDIRNALPSYLQLAQPFSVNDAGKKIKVADRAETLENPFNRNAIKTLAGARSKVAANGLGRGLTMPIHWYDEFAFIMYNKIIRMAATPSYSTASENAIRNGAPYGILLTTTPGDLSTDEGEYAFKLKNKATPFMEDYYDYSPLQLQELFAANNKSPFVYIRYTYQQLGKGNEYLKKMIKELDEDYDTVRREVLLEWAETSKDCPFTTEELNKINKYIKDSSKVETIMLCGYYPLYIYEKMNDRYYPPIIGVDVAGGYSKDSSTITMIDSKTTKVIACMNCNYISIQHLASCIYELVTKYAPNAIVNIERNGGFGASLLSQLLNTKIRRNIYYEVKERVLEERFDGIHTQRVKKTVKVYGSDNTPEARKLLMEILRERVEWHKDKFNSDIIYNELRLLETKKNGRIEHSSNSHDDQVFSYLWALYVWYYGKNITENFGIVKGDLSTDQNTFDEVCIDENYEDVDVVLDSDPDDPFEQGIQESLEVLKSCKTMSMEEHAIEQHEKDNDCLRRLMSTPQGRRIMTNATGIDYVNDKDPRYMTYEIPDEIFDIDDSKPTKTDIQEMFDNLNV